MKEITKNQLKKYRKNKQFKKIFLEEKKQSSMKKALEEIKKWESMKLLKTLISVKNYV